MISQYSRAAGANDTDDFVFRREVYEALEHVPLKKREREALALAFGVWGGRGGGYKAASLEMGVSSKRARQICLVAMEKIRKGVSSRRGVLEVLYGMPAIPWCSARGAATNTLPLPQPKDRGQRSVPGAPDTEPAPGHAMPAPPDLALLMPEAVGASRKGPVYVVLGDTATCIDPKAPTAPALLAFCMFAWWAWGNVS